MLFIIGVGWAKPVQIDPRNIPGRTKLMLVALAGPLSNTVLAIILTFFNVIIASYTININIPIEIISLIKELINMIIRINIILALFNLMPIPPLDGSNILRYFLPTPLEQAYLKIAPYGMFILLLIMFTIGFRFIFDAALIVQLYLYKLIQIII